MGRLFSTKVDRDQSVARYFLITPRILPARITYEMNTGFEGEALESTNAVSPVLEGAGKKRQKEETPIKSGDTQKEETPMK